MAADKKYERDEQPKNAEVWLTISLVSGFGRLDVDRLEDVAINLINFRNRAKDVHGVKIFEGY